SRRPTVRTRCWDTDSAPASGAGGLPPLPWGEDTEPRLPKAGIGEVGEGRVLSGEAPPLTNLRIGRKRPCCAILSPWGEDTEPRLPKAGIGGVGEGRVLSDEAP